MKLYNTLHHKLEAFIPKRDDRVGLYSCGPTVYDHAHIGNLSAFIYADTLRRVLEASGMHVAHGMNYTDVDDKTIRRSRERYPDMTPMEALRKLTDEYIKLFVDDMQRIGNDVHALTFLRATDKSVIEGMRQLISKLHRDGFAYIADDGVYFSIDAYRKSGKVYGQLVTLTDNNSSEARIRNDEYDKASAHDFALWKTQKVGEPAWPFVLDGHDLAGRPGWHIECSVMSGQILGQPFDIHTGGVDLMFPHHENEIAQSTASEEDPTMSRFFVHNEHMFVEGEKMSKSLNNFYTLQDILDRGYDPLAFRVLVLQSHYRSQSQFSWDTLAAAQNRLQGYREAADLLFQPVAHDRTNDVAGKSDADHANHPVQTDEFGTAFDLLLGHLQADLNTPEALSDLSGMLGRVAERRITAKAIDAYKAYLQKADGVLGLQLSEREDITAPQKQLIAEREAARATKDWAAADTIRGTLEAQGIGLRDQAGGAVWYRLSRG